MASSLSRFALRAFTLRTQTFRPAVVIPVQCRMISTTDKKKDSSIGLSVHQDGVTTKAANQVVNTDYENRKDWISHGLDFEDEDHDRWTYYGGIFLLITVMTCFTAWYVTYAPNVSWPNRDWVVREAYLELHRREKFGLPLIDPDFVPRQNIILPSEEELQDFEITI